MTEEMIDSIAREINRQCRELQEQVVIKALEENKKLIATYRCYKETICIRMKSNWVIFCNPPYSRHSLNKGEWITGLVRDYFQVNNRRIEEKNLKGLQDDYVKFFRLAQWSIDQNGSGVMGFITSNSYLENPTFRGMRYSLLKSFDEIYILYLHGTARKVEKNADDENIFGIGQGIAKRYISGNKRYAQALQY